MPERLRCISSGNIFRYPLLWRVEQCFPSLFTSSSSSSFRSCVAARFDGSSPVLSPPAVQLHVPPHLFLCWRSRIVYWLSFFFSACSISLFLSRDFPFATPTLRKEASILYYRFFAFRPLDTADSLTEPSSKVYTFFFFPLLTQISSRLAALENIFAPLTSSHLPDPIALAPFAFLVISPK